MALRQSLEQKQQQRLSQRQITLTRLIEASGDELNELIHKEIEENPALEIDGNDENDFSTDNRDEECDTDDLPEEVSIEEARERSETTREDVDFDSNADDWEPNDYNWEAANDRLEPTIPTTLSFRENLVFQVNFLNITEKENLIAKYIIGCLNDDGYLDSDSKSIANRLLINENVETTSAEVEQVLVQIVQKLDPAGIGARDLQECLLLQIRALLTPHDSPALHLAERIIQYHFELFTTKRFSQIIRRERVTQQDLEDALAVITNLNPKPGGGSEVNNQVTPDFIVTIENNEPVLSIANAYHPRLRVNREYEEMLAHLTSKRNAEAKKFIRDNIDKAKLFIELLPERERTMYLVMNEIIRYQKAYFLSGNPKDLRPMVLKDIGEKTHLDISTMSRVTSHRYALTPFGTILLKSLFSEGVGGESEEENVSALVVREELKELIESEDKKHPYTDERLAQLLKEKGFNISRRTVVKYREQLNIGNSNQRKTR